MLTTEVYMRSVKDQTDMVGSCELNLTSYALGNSQLLLTQYWVLLAIDSLLC